MSTFNPPPTDLPLGATAGEPPREWVDWFGELADALRNGYSGTVTLAKLTGGGSNGSLTFRSGILISVVLPT